MFENPQIQTFLSSEYAALLQVVFITIIAHIIERRSLNHVATLASRTSNIIDDALIDALRGPLPALIWMSGAYFALQVIRWPLVEPLIQYLPRFYQLGVIACISWFSFRLINEYAEGYIASHVRRDVEVDLTMVHGLSKLARITVGVISSLLIMHAIGFNISSLLALGGVGALAVGLAARDWVANLIGGLMVHLSRPFDVGESIRSPDRQIEGKVEHISWMQTRIRTPNMSVVFVPNSLFTTVVLENPSRITNRRIDLVVGIRHQDIDKVDAIVSDIRAMLVNHTEIDQEKNISVALDDFAETSVKLIVRAYTNTTDLTTFQSIKQSVLLQVAQIIQKHGARLYTTQE